MCGWPDTYLSTFLQQTPTGLSWNGRPTLPILMQFPTQHGTIDIIQEIETRYRAFGVKLLNDETGAITDAIAQQCWMNAYKITIDVLARWLRGQGRHPVTWVTLVEVMKTIGFNARYIEYSLQTAQQVSGLSQSVPSPLSFHLCQLQTILTLSFFILYKHKIRTITA